MQNQNTNSRLQLTHQVEKRFLPVLVGALAEKPVSPSKRAIAHILDVSLVHGFSLYFSKIAALVVVGFHMNTINATGAMSDALFRESMDLGNSLLTFTCFVSLSLLYFVGLPMVSGKTFGLGLLGLKITSDQGLGIENLSLRYGACLISYLSLGALCLGGMRDPSGKFYHDQVSGTRITHS